MASVPNDPDYHRPEPRAISVAIIGGGIGGISLALGLLKYSHIDVHVYEAAPAFGEIGAGVSLGPNAQRALEIIGPSAKEAMTKTATTNMWDSHANEYLQYKVGQGPLEGTLIHCEKNLTGQQSVHRAHFLNELVKGVPAQRAHFNKRLERLEDRDDEEGVHLFFKDGTSATADVVFGADGVHSCVREYLLGTEAAKPVFSGSVVYRGIVSMDAAVEKIGAEYAQNSYMWCGRGRLFIKGTSRVIAKFLTDRAMLSYPIDFGSTLNIVALIRGYDVWPHEKWITPAEHGELAKMFEGWGKTTQGLVQLLDTPDLAAWSLWDHPPAPTYYNGRVAMMGDAAHATTPFQGQGAGQAIEDACVLQALLGRVHNKTELPNVLEAYDEVRRPRSQRIVTTSREAAELDYMRLKGVGDDIEKMREKLDGRMHWIWHRDLVAQNAAAVKLFEEGLP